MDRGSLRQDPGRLISREAHPSAELNRFLAWLQAGNYVRQLDMNAKAAADEAEHAATMAAKAERATTTAAEVELSTGIAAEAERTTAPADALDAPAAQSETGFAAQGTNDDAAAEQRSVEAAEATVKVSANPGADVGQRLEAQPAGSARDGAAHEEGPGTESTRG